ncbi:MAG: DUF2061 domain-containing protein [Bacteroidota bacterium]|uniref:DUF2061 domain-containing protein n=1 Tax=Flagellimonas profundi TaxID=2915620 RepID=A0ABS3FGJ1_9FLAO|nr:DUF2061 domain-containing protein [Allomuricauda profundi]MBO0342091.1 DUF2061 domain-containing protein [Allomuricauda profundi]MEC7769998.1 DUF2061 domain-containing protein [Bacteroidota bacterium]
MTKKVSYKRHLAKTITWRLVGTLDTILLSWAITGNPFTGLKIGLAEVVTKMLLYYFHERIWLNAGIDDSRKRHIIKTLTWRVLGTLDTITLSWIISGDPFTGLKIGFAEVITKMMLYYFHERTWYKINYGLDKRNRAKRWRRTS